MATMFPCPNCGGQLRYQPETRKLKCVSCGEFQEPSEYVPDGKIGTEELNTNVYICPNCAGQIQLIDNDGMEFCPFCGTQATMQEHFSSEGVPDYILPFRINKKEAKTSFAKSTKRVHFKPDGLDKDENVDKLVGMYVPYYLYDFNINDSFKYQGKKSYTQGEYNITDYANVDVQAKVDSLKVPFDASQTLDDSVAVELEPYPLEQVEKFNPNYLAGFFVENSTVEKDLYKEDSLEKAIDCVYGQVKQQTGEYTPSSSDEKTIKEKLRASIRRTDTTGAYLPVYFLTTRYGDRVAYSMVNGTTGNCYVDMPIEKRKLFSASMVVSLIIFVVLLVLSFFLSFSYGFRAYAVLVL